MLKRSFEEFHTQSSAAKAQAEMERGNDALAALQARISLAQISYGLLD